MNRIRVFLILVFTSFLFLLTPKIVLAEDADRFVTIVNPVRISYYNKTPGESLRNQYSIIEKNNLPATWLLTYDSIQNQFVINEIKQMDKKQEFGLFLEISPSFAKDAGVVYHDTGSWHHATSVFLSGYTQEERIKLIDKDFQKFKDILGYYPESVGAWGTDSFSLTYMKNKYGIVANLTCSDQLSTDGYQIWGQPWAMPYYPSKFYSIAPASTSENKLDVVNLQWAPRDPLNGYESSLYSTQDYTVAKQPQKTDFFKKMAELYLSYGQITVGLESDLDPWAYVYEFTNQMDAVRDLRQKGTLVVTISDYANWYRKKYPNISPSTLIKSKDLLGTDTESFWYSSPNYRLFYTKKNSEIHINDLRIYNSNLQEPYYVSPNSSSNLTINIPYVISVSENPSDAWILPKETKIITDENSIQIEGQNLKIPNKVKNSELIRMVQVGNRITITFPKQDISREGIVFRDFSVEAIHFFKEKKSILKLLVGKDWNYFKKVDYIIPQGEIYALLYLKSLPAGKVLVYDNECLQCTYHTELPPPSFSNRRSYVEKFSNHSIIYNTSVFNAKDRKNGKEDLKKTGVKYVYMVKFEGYEEKLPFSPGDLDVEKVFSNANAEIWRVK